VNRDERRLDLVARRATIIRELEILSVFRGGGPDPAAVMRLRSELADVEAEIAALESGTTLALT
jgi:hypothetical protein